MNWRVSFQHSGFFCDRELAEVMLRDAQRVIYRDFEFTLYFEWHPDASFVFNEIRARYNGIAGITSFQIGSVGEAVQLSTRDLCATVSSYDELVTRHGINLPFP